MTVAELIEKLMCFQPDLPVVTAGFDESAIDDIEIVEIRKVRFNVRKNYGHTGRHELDEEHGKSAVFIDF